MCGQIHEDHIIKCLVNTKDGKFRSLDELTTLGNRLFLICMHLLVKDHEKKASDLLSWLKNFKAFKISPSTFYRIMAHYRVTNNITEQNDKNKMIKITVERKKTKSESKVIADGKNNKLRSNCGIHSYQQMSNTLQISKSNIAYRVKKYDIKFSKNVHTCFFCNLGIRPKDEEKVEERESWIKNIKSGCGIHSHREMSLSLGISKSKFSYYVKNRKIKFEENSDCYFCKNIPSDSKTENPEASKPENDEHCDSLSEASLNETKTPEIQPVFKPEEVLIKTDDCDSFHEDSLSEDNFSKPGEEITIKTENCDPFSDNPLNIAKFPEFQLASNPEEVLIKTENYDSLSDSELNEDNFSKPEEEISIKTENYDSFMDTSSSEMKFAGDPLKI